MIMAVLPRRWILRKSGRCPNQDHSVLDYYLSDSFLSDPTSVLMKEA